MFTRIIPDPTCIYSVHVATHRAFMFRCYGLGCLRLQKYVLPHPVHMSTYCAAMTPHIRYTSFEQLRAKLLTAAEEAGRYEVA